MRLLFLISLLLITLEANIKKDIYNLYQNKSYIAACKLGLSQLNNNKRDESYVSLYAFSCLKADYIDRLGLAVTYLKKTEESRENAAYFSLLLMQKNLLIHSLLDNSDLSDLNFPSTDHIISKVFDLYQKESKHFKHSIYTFHDDENDKLSYKLYIIEQSNANRMVIEGYYDTIMTHRHTFR